MRVAGDGRIRLAVDPDDEDGAAGARRRIGDDERHRAAAGNDRERTALRGRSLRGLVQGHARGEQRGRSPPFRMKSTIIITGSTSGYFSATRSTRSARVPPPLKIAW